MTTPTTFRDLPEGPEMVVIPPGRFLMGSPENEPRRRDNEGPQHEVTIAYSFAAGRFPVTVDEWEACVADGGLSGHRPIVHHSGGTHPVFYVSWHDAQAYIAWLSQKTGHAYRLLSEAEWEYAARAGTTTPFSYWTTITPGEPTPVGSFPANAFGLHDMHGNVSEWTQDCWQDNYVGAPTDGSPCTSGRFDQRVVRGMAWYYVPPDYRAALRGWCLALCRGPNSGFRVARTLWPVSSVAAVIQSPAKTAPTIVHVRRI